MRVDSDLESGAIEVLKDGTGEIELAIRSDTAAEFRQWFHFRGRGAKGKPTTIRFVNAGECTYADAWNGYRVCASNDGEKWFRIPTEFDGSVMTSRHTPTSDAAFYAYFAPYSVARRDALLAKISRSKRARVDIVGRSIQGLPLPMVTFGEDGDDKRKVFIIARQHPGETAAEWFAEGALERLVDDKDDLAKAILERAVVRVVPCMNPDGSVLGNLRTNAAGIDLNRAWLEPDEETSPEVLAVRAAMLDLGVDLFLDVHADERNPYIFAAGDEGNPDYDERIEALEELFTGSLSELDTDFQREYGYDRELPGEGNLAIAGNWAGEQFDCLALTLEMPFKDNANHPDPLRGWSPDRCKHFGRTTLESVFVCLDQLRD